jgi:hypothetical protein
VKRPRGPCGDAAIVVLPSLERLFDDEMLEAMEEQNAEPVADSELRSLFESLFPNGFAGPDVVAELAPEGMGALAARGVFSPVRGTRIR